MLAHWIPGIFPLRDPVMIFAIVLVLFLTAPMVMARFRLPGMIGLLLAGAILGPHALGVLARDSSFVLLGAVGLTYIMFSAALEIDLTVFRKYGVQGVVFGLLTFLVPQGLGTIIAYYILGFDWLAAILLASMFASHTLLAYPIVSRLGLSSNQAVTATLGATIITDTLALLVLAVIAAMAKGQAGEALWWRLGVSLSGFVAVILLGLPRLGRWFFRKVPDDPTAQFVFILSSVFLSAALSHMAGLEPIVGAFLSGIALNRLIPHNSTLMSRLTFTGDALFIPFFLLSVGMLLDVRVLFGGFRSWVVAIGMTVTVIGTKWLAAEVTRLLFRYRLEEGRVMFGLSVVQAAATLAAVMVGHRIGLFDDTVINGTIVMILVTCILGPYVVAKYAAPLAAAAEMSPVTTNSGGGILLPLMSAEQVEPAMELALLLRQPRSKERIFPAFVADDGDELAQSMAQADKFLMQAVSQASATNCVAEPLKRVGAHPGRALVRARKEIGAGTVVVPWDVAQSHKGARFGKVTDELVNDSSADLLLCRLPSSLNTCTRIFVLFPPGVADTSGFLRGLDLLKAMATQLGASFLLMGQQEDKETLVNAFVRVGESRKTFVSYPSLRLCFPVFEEHVRPTDLLVLYGLREADTTAMPEYTGMAGRIAGKYPKQNFVLLFGSTMKEEIRVSSKQQ